MKKMKQETAALPQPGQICSTREAAAMLGVSLRTVQLWVESGMLDAWKTVGGHRRIDRRSVERLMQSRQAKSVPAGRRGFRVLVLEDDPALLELYRLAIEGWTPAPAVITAANGFEGLIEIGKSVPDLLITDLKMPAMDGFELILHLRRNPRHKGMHIVAATGLSKAEIERKGGLPKDVTVFCKPVPFAQLESLVRGLMMGAGKAAGA